MTSRVLMTDVQDDDWVIASNQTVKDFPLDPDWVRVLFGTDMHPSGIPKVC